MDWGTQFKANDLLTGAKFDWSEYNFVCFDPQGNLAHIIGEEKN